jgi:protein subunit release factor A
MELGSHHISLEERLMKRTLEIKSAEGGKDSQLFVNNLAQAYTRMFDRLG